MSRYVFKYSITKSTDGPDDIYMGQSEFRLLETAVRYALMKFKAEGITNIKLIESRAIDNATQTHLIGTQGKETVLIDFTVTETEDTSLNAQILSILEKELT